MVQAIMMKTAPPKRGIKDIFLLKPMLAPHTSCEYCQPQNKTKKGYIILLAV